MDKSEYVLAVEPDGKRSPEDLRERLDLFRQSIREAREATDSPALGAVEAFVGSDDERGRAVERVSAAGYASNDLFAFQYRGQLVHELPEVQANFSRSRHAAEEGGAQCLVCGKNGPLAEKHPTVKIPGGTTSGIALVSFNSIRSANVSSFRPEVAPPEKSTQYQHNKEYDKDAKRHACGRLHSFGLGPWPRIEGS